MLYFGQPLSAVLIAQGNAVTFPAGLGLLQQAGGQPLTAFFPANSSADAISRIIGAERGPVQPGADRKTGDYRIAPGVVQQGIYLPQLNAVVAGIEAADIGHHQNAGQCDEGKHQQNFQQGKAALAGRPAMSRRAVRDQYPRHRPHRRARRRPRTRPT